MVSFHNQTFDKNSQFVSHFRDRDPWTAFVVPSPVRSGILLNSIVNYACLNDGNGKQQPLHPPQQHLTQPKLQVHMRATQKRT